MTMHAAGSYTINQWDEKTFRTLETGGKLTRATVTTTFTGDWSGEGVADYVMAYRPDDSAEYTGVQWVKGTLGGRSGEIALQLIGKFEQGIASATWTVVTATGELAGLHGTGGFSAGHGMTADYTLDYDQ
jgi:hypothetical protein